MIAAGLSPFFYRDNAARRQVQAALGDYALRSSIELAAVSIEDRDATDVYSRVYTKIFASIFVRGRAASKNFDRYTQPAREGSVVERVASGRLPAFRYSGPLASIPGDAALAYIKTADGHIYRVFRGTILDVRASQKARKNVFIDPFFSPRSYRQGEPIASRPWEAGNPWTPAPVKALVLVCPDEDGSFQQWGAGGLPQDALIRETELALAEIDMHVGFSRAEETMGLFFSRMPTTRKTVAEIFADRPWTNAVKAGSGDSVMNFYRDGMVDYRAQSGVHVYEPYDPDRTYLGGYDDVTLVERPPLSNTDLSIMAARISRYAERASSPVTRGTYDLGD